MSRCSKSIARSQKRRTAAMSWVTSSTVRPSARMRANSSKHFCWNEASPTASTSSMSRVSAWTWIITARARRDEHGEGGPDHRPARVGLELQVDELVQLGEVDDRVEAPAGLARREPEHR